MAIPIRVIQDLSTRKSRHIVTLDSALAISFNRRQARLIRSDKRFGIHAHAMLKHLIINVLESKEHMKYAVKHRLFD